MDSRRDQKSAIYPNGKGPPYPEFAQYLWNGDYQQILWLGVNGFIVIDHPDREILLVDPWPTVHSPWIGKIPFNKPRPLTNGAADAKARIRSLARFLRRSREGKRGYRLGAILLSHMHFDHCDDVPLLLELLASPEGACTTREGLTFDLDGAPFPIEELPAVCGDFDSLAYLKTRSLGVYWRALFRQGEDQRLPEGYFRGQQELASMLQHAPPTSPTWEAVKARYARPDDGDAWRELTWDYRSMYYDDTFNEQVLKGDLAARRVAPGTPADSFRLPGSAFEIQPYVWDHMNTPVGPLVGEGALDDQKSGSFQRISAFMVQRGNLEGAKRTFFVGSAGEMGGEHTRPAPVAPFPLIETDVLIQAIQADKMEGVPLDYPLARMMSASRSFTLRNVAIRDYLAFCHFEEFARTVADRPRLEDDFRAAVGDTLAELDRLIKEGKCHPANRDLLTAERAFVLSRWGEGFGGRKLPRSAIALRPAAAAPRRSPPGRARRRASTPRRPG